MTDCILWDGYVNRDGYGEMLLDRRKRPVHRLAYEGVNGPLSDNFQVHHKCGVKSCINVAHLEALSASDHCRQHEPSQYITPAGTATHCSRGHNLQITGSRNGWGKCRLCKNAAQRRYLRKHRDNRKLLITTPRR